MRNDRRTEPSTIQLSTGRSRHEELVTTAQKLLNEAKRDEAVEKIAAVYAKAGVMDQFVGHFHDVPHIFSRGMQDEAFTWLDRKLSHTPR